MIKLVFAVLFIQNLFLAEDLPQIREDYYASLDNEKFAESFYKKLKNKNLSDPIILAYYGSAQAIRAKHAFNPYNKISYLKGGLNSLGSAISKNPENLEIRFLRFSLEHHVPSFLGMSKHLDLDRKKIVELARDKKFGAMNKPLLVNLLRFMKETRRCTPQEIAILDQAILNG